MAKLQRLESRKIEKIWGVERLPQPFAQVKIGEICFAPPATCPLMAKYIFTSEALSIQVHPDDAYARTHGLASGKEECWYILAAEPGARLAAGLSRHVEKEEFAVLLERGEIEQVMQWHDVRAGMFFHIPAGTIHAIGAGISLVEIQQDCDATYRLHDYGRPRELQLVDALAVAETGPVRSDFCRLVEAAKSTSLVATPRFNVAHVAGRDLSPLPPEERGAMLLPLDGKISVEGEVIAPGECVWTENSRAVEPSRDARFLAAWI